MYVVCAFKVQMNVCVVLTSVTGHNFDPTLIAILIKYISMSGRM